MDEKEKEITEETNQAEEKPTLTPQEPGIGDLMKEGTRKAIAALVVFLLIVAYLAGLAYAEVHGLNLLRDGVAEDLLMWAYAGMVSLGVLAVALPLALHYWAFDPLHRIATFICYGIDLALLGINSFTDFGTNNGQQLVQWAQFYKDYIVPATPVIAAVMATLLLLLSPHARAFVLRQTLRAAMMQKQADLIMKAANNPAVTETVQVAAQQEVELALSELFGRPVTPVAGYAMPAEPKGGGFLKSFFGSLWQHTQRAFSLGMPPRYQESSSDQQEQENAPKA